MVNGNRRHFQANTLYTNITTNINVLLFLATVNNKKTNLSLKICTEKNHCLSYLSHKITCQVKVNANIRTEAVSVF